MSTKSTPRASQGAPPLMVLAAWLENAHHRDDRVLSFPANTSGAIRQARPVGAEYDMQEVEAIVLALEPRDSKVCERLDSLGLNILCSIFMYSQECLAQQRGLCLLATSLHRDEGDSAWEAAHKQGKKEALGQAALTLLIKGFLKTDASDKLRRWLGVLTLELLEDCPVNIEKLISDPPKERHWQYLSEVIEHGSCQVLKLLAGSMIREMLSFGVSPDDFWTSETGLNLFSKFPKSQHHNSQWVTSFEEFVDGLVLEKILTQEVSSVIFAQAVHVGDRKWDLKEASDILVTLSEELNVIVPAKDPNSTIYIDVPLESILEVSFDKEFLTDSQNPTYRVIIQLIDRVATNCTLNATEYAERHVALAFASENDANTLRRLLMSTNVQTDGFSPQSQSAATEVLEPILSDDELAGPGPALSHSQILMRTASVASALIPHRNEVCTINPLRLERAHTSQGASAEHREGSSSSMIEQDEDSQKVCHSVKMADEGIDVSDDGSWVMKAFEGIDVSQIGGLSHDETQHQDFQAPAPNNTSSIARVLYSQPLSNEKQEPKGGFDRSSDTGLSSSLRRQPGLNAIQNASDFGAQVPQHAVSPVEQVKKASRPEYQDGEYNELYDASPKVNHGQRRSPRNTAQDNLLQRLERLQKPASRQTSVNTGPHTKLSKQLRNANGIVESHTEQTVDNGLAPLTKNGAGDVKTSGDRKKSKIPVHTKVRTRKKEPTKSTKKTSQIKGKATTTEESSKAAFDNYDSPPSPTHADSIQAPDDKKKATATRPKVARVPRNKQEQAKPISAKAAATNSSKGPTLQLKKGSKDKAKTKGSIQDSAARRLDGKMLDNDDDAIWDFDQAHSGENPQLLRQSGQPTKTARKREVSVPKTKEDRAQTLLHPGKAKANKATKAQTQGPKGRVTKAKPAPAVLSQPRSRRAAAIKANKKIQGLDESDDIVDDEDVVPVLTRGNRNASSDAAKVPKIPKVRGGGDSRATSHGKLPTAKFPVQYSTPDSVSPDSLEGQRSGSVSHPKALSSAKKVDLVRDAPAEAFRAAHSDTLHKENPTSAAETSIIPLHSRDGDKSDQPNSASVEKGVEMSEARVDLVPGSVSRLYKSITETGATPTLPLKRDDVNQGEFNPTKTAGPGDQEPAEHVLPHTDDVLFELDLKSDRVAEEVNPSRAPTAPTVVEPRQRRRSPRLAAAAPKSLPEATTTRSDPFGAKLKDTNTKVKSRDGHANVKSKEANTPKPAKPAELARSSREPKASAFNGLEASSFEEAKQVKNPRRYLKSAIQVDGEGGDSLIQMLKPAREPISASKGENKRRTEQVGDTSSKRVKAAAHERLERPSAKREPADDAKKTPPPVVSNRPLVIGFSRSGPRNQGTVSMKKPEPPTHVRTGAPGAGFASVRGALREPPEDIAHNLDATQKKARGSPPRKQPEHLETVNAVATREPNTQEHRAQKRKLHPFLDEPAPWEHEQLLKRQKRDVETPPSPHTHHPNMLPDASPSVIHDRSQRLGSQHTRVNENGSPMPFLITRHEETAAEEHYSDEDDGNNALAEARLEDPNVLQEDDPILPEPIFPLVPVESTSKIKTKVHESLSNNSKQVPSSPHAPSVFGAMPPHHIYHDGEIVNAETKESIIPVKPQDPFLGAAQNLQNPFMNALRKSTEIAAKRLIPGAKEKGGSRVVVVRPSLNMGEDPDKTLVEPKLREKYKQVHVSEASSSSHSSFSSQASSQPGESSEEESDGETEANWRKGLEPHQENMLECLLTISHRLIRHLIDKETAIKDMVTDFASHGNRLIEGYEQGLQEYIDSCRANNDRRHQNLKKMFEKAQADRATTSKAVVKRRAQDMKAQWETQQEALMANMAAALAACAE